MIWLLPLALAGICNAVMDTLHHGWKSSLFYGIAGEYELAFWGDANRVWLRKYTNPHAPAELRNLKARFRIPVLRYLFEAINDGWHLMKTLMWVFVAGGAVLYEPLFGFPLDIAIAFAAITVPFQVCYSLLRGSP